MKSQRNSQSNSTVTRRQKNIANKRASPLWLNISNTPPFLFLEIIKKKTYKKRRRRYSILNFFEELEWRPLNFLLVLGSTQPMRN
jgi:hypothetical protein